MILFKEDLYKHRCMLDVDTKNLSFIKMAMLLKRMGIDNYMFFLALTQPELKKYDPHNLKDDSEELKLRIALECKINPWYFLREVCRVNASGKGSIPFRLSRANLAQAWCAYNSVDLFETIPRQNGKTIGAVGIYEHIMYLAGEHLVMGMFARDTKLQHINVQRIKDMRDALPPWMINKSTDDANNKEGLSYKALDNTLTTYVGQKDKVAAEDQGRGLTFAWQLWDEPCFYSNIDKSFATATSGMDEGRTSCIESGCPASLMMISTAGDIDDPRGRFCYEMVVDAYRFNESLYDIENQEALHRFLKANSDNGMVYIEYSYKQLGRTEEWFKISTRNKTKRQIEKDYLNKWSHGSGESIFPADLMKRVSDSVAEPVACTMFEDLQIRWYQDPKTVDRNKPYIIASDTSDNAGRDSTTMIMIDPEDLAPVAVLKSNISNLSYVVRCIKKFLVDFKRSIFIPERNKNGAAFIDFIIAMTRGDRTFDPFSRIYNTYVQDYNSDTPSFKSLDLQNGTVRSHFGFNTTSGSRNTLYSTVLTTAVKLCADRIKDASLAREILSLTRRNGRIDHSVEGHDDLLISFLIAVWFVLFGRHHNIYGIMPDELMSKLTEDGEETTLDQKKESKVLRERGQELLKLISHCANEIVKGAYKRELDMIEDMLDEEIVPEDTSVKALDQVYQQSAKSNISVTPRGYTLEQLVGII